MRLTIPPEPAIIRPTTNTTTQTWDFDSLGLWFGNQLPRYLWHDADWATPLKAEGYTWQGFLKILSLHKKDMIRWARHALTWKDFLLRIQDTITDPIFKTLITKQTNQEDLP